VSRRRVFLSYFFRLSLQILALEAVFLAIAWLLHRYWSILQRFSFADVLFFVSVVVGMIGSFGMLHNPFAIALSPLGVWAPSIRVTEEEKQVQLVDELLHQTSFNLRLLAVGVITFLLAVALTFIK